MRREIDSTLDRGGCTAHEVGTEEALGTCLTLLFAESQHCTFKVCGYNVVHNPCRLQPLVGKPPGCYVRTGDLGIFMMPVLSSHTGLELA